MHIKIKDQRNQLGAKANQSSPIFCQKSEKNYIIFPLNSLPEMAITAQNQGFTC
jgi:hypothetical protein